MSIATRGGFPYQFDKEISKMTYMKYAEYPKEFDKVAKVENWNPSWGKSYSEAEITGLGQLRAMGEGEAISYDVPAEGHKKTITTVKYGLGFQRTEEMGDDELFGMLKKVPDSLGRSASVCVDTNFFNLFNNGFTATTGTLSWDGDPVFSSSHTPLKDTTDQSNVGSADLSQASLEAAFEYFDTLKDEAGLPLSLKPNKLLIPTGLKWLANDLLKATGRVWDYTSRTGGYVTVGSGDSVSPGNGPLLNGTNPTNGLVDGWSIQASRYLTDSDAWFLLSDQHDFRFYWKKKPTMSSSDDFATDNKMFKLVMRFSVGVFDWRGAYGSPGAG